VHFFLHPANSINAMDAKIIGLCNFFMGWFLLSVGATPTETNISQREPMSKPNTFVNYSI